MKTGIELITKERYSQIRKHGFTIERDRKYNTNGQLVKGALCVLEKVGRGPGFTNVEHKWPEDWDPKFENRIRFKDDIGKLSVAGAFYRAENSRLGSGKYKTQIQEIAKRIDALLKTQSTEV